MNIDAIIFILEPMFHWGVIYLSYRCGKFLVIQENDSQVLLDKWKLLVTAIGKVLIAVFGITLYFGVQPNEEFGFTNYIFKLTVLMLLPAIFGVVKWYCRMQNMTVDELKELKSKSFIKNR